MNRMQQGFTLVMAIFILVVLSLISAYMVRLAAIQQIGSSYVIQNARAYLSAKSGIEWAIARISGGGGCADLIAASPMSFSDINGFTVSISCSNQNFSEGTDSLDFFRISVLSEFGNYASADYVSRKLEVTIIN